LKRQKSLKKPKRAANVLRRRSVAPPAAELPSFEFEGGKEVDQQFRSGADLQGRSNTPSLQMEPAGQPGRRQLRRRSGSLGGPLRTDQAIPWQKGSGNAMGRFGESAGHFRGEKHGPSAAHEFPPRITIRFDVQEETEPVLQ
jgi:hypothetical protein